MNRHLERQKRIGDTREVWALKPIEPDARIMNWLANTVLVLHALIVLFIVGGLIDIWTGAWLKRVGSAIACSGSRISQR